MGGWNPPPPKYHISESFGGMRRTMGFCSSNKSGGGESSERGESLHYGTCRGGALGLLSGEGISWGGVRGVVDEWGALLAPNCCELWVIFSPQMSPPALLMEQNVFFVGDLALLG